MISYLMLSKLEGVGIIHPFYRSGNRGSELLRRPTANNTKCHIAPFPAVVSFLERTYYVFCGLGKPLVCIWLSCARMVQLVAFAKPS